jgi:cytochrome c biogenesis protein CcdA/thiol-disulfide isomerase/thioredoxin
MTLLFISFIAGIITVLAPCVLPLLPVIVGRSLNGKRSLKRALVVTLSLSVSVVLFTLLIKVSAVFIGVPESFWKWFSGSIIIFFGFITLFPSIWDRISFLSKLNIESNKILGQGYKRQDLLGDIIVGASLGPVFSTCSPTYFLVLASVLPQHFITGLFYLVTYSVGLSLSLLLVSFVGGQILDNVGVVADPNSKFKKILGIVFLLVGLGIISGFDKSLQTKILNAGFFDITKVEQKFLSGITNKSQNNTVEDLDSKTKEQSNKKDADGFLSISEKSKKYSLAKEISTPDGFVNTDGKPINILELKGKVILLDIWTYSCINCQRTLPYLNEWYKKYKDQGLVIIGLHTPEFAFERVLSNVEKATKDFDIKYPVVLDNDYSTWNDYGNSYWPRKYLIDIDGFIVYDHIGEGDYDQTEKAIQKALLERKAKVNSTADISQEISIPKNAIPLDSVKTSSPETYFGANRNEFLANGLRGVLGKQVLVIPESILPNKLYLGGSWDIKEEYALGKPGSSVVFKYGAKNVYLVSGSESGSEISVYKDDLLIEKITIQDEKLYNLIKDLDYGEHILRLEVNKGDLKVFTFTFG